MDVGGGGRRPTGKVALCRACTPPLTVGARRRDGGESGIQVLGAGAKSIGNVHSGISSISEPADARAGRRETEETLATSFREGAGHGGPRCPNRRCIRIRAQWTWRLRHLTHLAEPPNLAGPDLLTVPAARGRSYHLSVTRSIPPATQPTPNPIPPNRPPAFFPNLPTLSLTLPTFT